MSTTTLKCPNCGAPAEPDARRCGFCRARLATVKCAACFGLMFDGSVFCPQCGTRRGTAHREEADVPCPGCRTPMQRLTIGTTVLLECTGCDGVWVDAAVFEALCADRESQAAVLHRFADEARAAGDRVRYRPCARCGKMMNRVNFGRISGVVVDVCRGHGTYLDPGELHRIAAFILDGGIGRARQRHIEELREQERRLRNVEARLARDRGKAFAQSGGMRRDAWRLMVGD